MAVNDKEADSMSGEESSKSSLSDEELLKAISNKVTTSNVEDVVAAILDRHHKAVNLDTDELERAIERNKSEIKTQRNVIDQANRTLNE